MQISDPQFLYIILILPALFGLTLIGEGFHKLANEETNGIISIIFGVVFVVVVGIAYYYFSHFVVYH